MWEHVSKFVTTEPSVWWVGCILMVIIASLAFGKLIDDLMTQRERDDD